jgi:hypothetical protein
MVIGLAALGGARTGGQASEYRLAACAAGAYIGAAA